MCGLLCLVAFNTPSFAHANENILEAYYNVSATTSGIYEVCEDFKNSSHHLSYRIDNNLSSLHTQAQELYDERILKAKECFDINEEQAEQINQRAIEKYKKSNVGQIMEIAKKLGPNTYVNEQDAYSRLEGCNALSQMLKNAIIRFSNEEATCDNLD